MRMCRGFTTRCMEARHTVRRYAECSGQKRTCAGNVRRGLPLETAVSCFPRSCSTGWAQVNQSYDANIDDVRSKVRYDLEYLQRQGLAEDVKIMLKTLPVMLLKRGGW